MTAKKKKLSSLDELADEIRAWLLDLDTSVRHMAQKDVEIKALRHLAQRLEFELASATRYGARNGRSKNMTMHALRALNHYREHFGKPPIGITDDGALWEPGAKK